MIFDVWMNTSSETQNTGVWIQLREKIHVCIDIKVTVNVRCFLCVHVQVRAPQICFMNGSYMVNGKRNKSY